MSIFQLVTHHGSDLTDLTLRTNSHFSASINTLTQGISAYHQNYSERKHVDAL